MKFFLVLVCGLTCILSIGLLLLAWKAPTTPVLVALVGVAGAVVGSLATAAAQLLQFFIAEREKSKTDDARKQLLKKMLLDQRFEWRRLDTLMHVTGADEESTKRLLLEIGARASENGTPVWALLARKPLPSVE